MSFKHAVALGDDGRQVADRCADGLEGATADLGFIYVTEMLGSELGAIAARLGERTGIGTWVGAVAPAISATGVEYYDEPACAVLACDIGPDQFHVLDGLHSPGEALGEACDEWLKRQTQRLGIFHADVRNRDLLPIVGALAEQSGAYLIGGLTTQHFEHTQIAGRITGGGVTGVFLGDGVEIVTGLTQGCSPIGPVHTVTAGTDDLLMELDGEPALEILRRELGPGFDGDWNRLAGLIHVGRPVEGSDTGDYLVRGLLSADTQRGWLQIGSQIEAGDQLLFVRRDATTALADLEIMLERLDRRVGGKPKAGLYHNCIARGRNQFGPGSEELQTIKDRLGEFPLIGMFGNGEISHDRVYSYTGVLTLFI